MEHAAHPGAAVIHEPQKLAVVNGLAKLWARDELFSPATVAVEIPSSCCGEKKISASD
jgi:hypothetical protein